MMVEIHEWFGLSYGLAASFEILRFGISYRGIEYPLEEIVLFEEIPYGESLTKLFFPQRVAFVRRALALLSVLIRSWV